MRSITVERTISMGHRLPSYKGICSSPHGHNVRVEVEVLLDPGQFVDFKEIDQVLEKLLSDFDHAMVLQDNDPLLETLKRMNFRTVGFEFEPTTENIAEWIFNRFLRRFQVIKVVVHETGKYSATVTV